MARKRMISPEFWSDEKIGKLSHGCRLFYIGLWNFADDEGRFPADFNLLRSFIFPYDRNVKVKKYMRDLFPLVGLYEVSGCVFGAIKNWKRWQKIDKPQPSNLPKPPDNTWSVLSRFCQSTEQVHPKKDPYLVSTLTNVAKCHISPSEVQEKYDVVHNNTDDDIFDESSGNDRELVDPNRIEENRIEENNPGTEILTSKNDVDFLIKKATPKNQTHQKNYNIDLNDFNVSNKNKVLNYPAKQKLWNKCLQLFEVRAWNVKLLRSVFEVCSREVREADITGELYPYFEKCLANYINLNAELLSVKPERKRTYE